MVIVGAYVRIALNKRGQKWSSWAWYKAQPVCYSNFSKLCSLQKLVSSDLHRLFGEEPSCGWQRSKDHQTMPPQSGYLLIQTILIAGSKIVIIYYLILIVVQLVWFFRLYSTSKGWPFASWLTRIINHLLCIHFYFLLSFLFFSVLFSFFLFYWLLCIHNPSRNDDMVTLSTVVSPWERNCARD